MGTEIGLGKGDREGGIGRKIESWIAFSPVSTDYKLVVD
jgi:hypothetical protein